MRPAFFLSVLVLALLVPVLRAQVVAVEEQVSLFYSINQKVYRVSEFEKGLPKLDQEVEHSEAPDPDRIDNFQWQVGGALPVAAEYAAPMVSYAVKWVTPTYKERAKKVKIEAHLNVQEAMHGAGWSDLHPTDMIVVGWVADGVVAEAFVTRGDADRRYTSVGKFVVGKGREGGFPLCWVVRDGKPLARSAVAAWDPYFFDQPAGEVSRTLLEARDAHGNTALHYAAGNGLIALLDALLLAQKRLVRNFNGRRVSPLSFAADCGRVDAAARLIAANAPLRDGPNDVNWILYNSTSNGNLEVLKALAPGKSKDNDQYSHALLLALNSNLEDQAVFLMDLGGKFSLREGSTKEGIVLSKFANGFPSMGFRLMDHLKMKPTLSEKGFNLFHAAASYADIELLDLIRAMGADLLQKTEKGLLPMDVAVGLGNVEAICWFIDNGGRNPAGDGFVYPLFYAIEAGRDESVQCLINYGYDVNREVARGVTPIMYAIARGEAQIAQSLLGAGGVWDVASPYMPVVVKSILKADAADLLRSVLDQGWDDGQDLGAGVGVSMLASFYEAQNCVSLLEGMGRVVSGGPPAPRELDAKVRFLTPLAIDYPVELQRKYGDREIGLQLAFGEDGQLVAFRSLTDLEPDLFDLIENATTQLRVEPPLMGGQATPVSIRIRTELEADMSDDKIFDLASVDEKPRALRQAKPIYPYAMQQTGSSGRVLVEFVLDSKGVVLDARVLNSSHGAFDAPAVRSIEETSWEPARKGGVPVACRVRQELVFTP